jgi:hypothetical protein
MALMGHGLICAGQSRPVGKSPLKRSKRLAL